MSIHYHTNGARVFADGKAISLTEVVNRLQTADLLTDFITMDNIELLNTVTIPEDIQTAEDFINWVKDN